MNRVNIKSGLIVTIGLFITLWVLILFLFDGIVFKWSAFIRLPLVLSVFLIILSIFIKWGWKSSIFKNWLILIPNLEGKWKGKIIPVSKNNENNTENKTPISFKILISQTLFHLSVIGETEEMKSESYIAAFDIRKNENIYRFTYTYISRPKLRYRDSNPIHDGSVILNIIGDPPTQLKGEYWTSRKSIGEIELSRINK